MFNLFNNKDQKLEQAKLELIEDLKNGSIDYLLEQMNSTEIYSLLLNEKRDTGRSNTDDISWYAYRRAEKLNSPLEKQELLDRLNSTEDCNRKKHIYFCLAHYCKNTTDNSLFNFLMNRLETEKDNSCRLSILIGIAYMPKESVLNIEPLKKLIKIRNRDLKINSIIALQKTNDKEVEDLLLSIFVDTKDSHTKSMIVHTLETIGTIKSISFLKEAYKKTRDYGLRGDIERTIYKIEAKQ
jgi:hypothetical protein